MSRLINETFKGTSLCGKTLTYCCELHLRIPLKLQWRLLMS